MGRKILLDEVAFVKVPRLENTLAYVEGHKEGRCCYSVRNKKQGAQGGVGVTET